MSYEATLVRHYADVYSRLRGRAPAGPMRPMLRWSTPFVVEIVQTDEEKIAAIIVAVGDHPSVPAIIVATAQHYGLSSQEMLLHSRQQRVAKPRLIAMAIARAITDRSYGQIALHFSRELWTVPRAVEKYGPLVERAMVM